ncbi:hypothetical protein [Cellulomonas sp. APG4]|uniref:hypothetical protein n=1 Tax=Cellulomonas sp. APG4 TaxID=1538656 RepID=UPI001ED8FEF4|nr:hypothetical protein [Cellulomonas sp. APG4]
MVSSWGSASVAHPIARLVSLARGPISGWSSEKVTTEQPASGHRQIRLRQQINTEAPNAGASCTR